MIRNLIPILPCFLSPYSFFQGFMVHELSSDAATMSVKIVSSSSGQAIYQTTLTQRRRPKSAQQMDIDGDDHTAMAPL